MEMNRYLIAALYVMAGCVAALPIGVRGSIVVGGADGYRLLISPTEKVVSVVSEQKSADEIIPGRSDKEYCKTDIRVEKLANTSYEAVLLGWKVPEISANPIRAPGW